MYYFLTTILLFLTELLYIRYAGPYILDLPNERSSHARPTVRGGGIIFYLAALCYLVYSGFAYPLFFAGLSLVAIGSFWDDVRGLSRRLRIGMHLTSLILIFSDLPFGLPSWGLALFIVVAIGVINAYNFMDGINGITAAYSLVALGTLWYLDTIVVDFADSRLMATVSLGVLIFSFFNFRKKALCFAGDVGAVSMAFVLIFLMGQLIMATGSYVWILLLSVYGVDSVGTIIQRLIRRENIFDAHRSHLYQLLTNEAGWPHVVVSLIYGAAQLLFNIGLIYFLQSPDLPYYIAFSFLLMTGVFAYLKIYVFKVFTASGYTE